jgi:hypothetical protein
MIMKTGTFTRAFLALFACIVTISCSDDEKDNNGVQGTSGLTIRMTDAPGDFDEVNVEVIDVKIKTSNDEGEGGWVSIGNINEGVYDLLDLTGGISVMLAENDVPSGHLGQIRLILGDNNTVVKDGVTYPLNTPSAQQSGLKLQVNHELEPNIDYNFLIDFDVHQSVVEAGNSGNFNLHPVLRVTTEASSGAISGLVTPIGYQLMASVNAGGQVISAYANDLGLFVLQGVPAGTYTVTITADAAAGVAPVTIENVTVVTGDTTELGSISI